MPLANRQVSGEGGVGHRRRGVLIIYPAAGGGITPCNGEAIKHRASAHADGGDDGAGACAIDGGHIVAYAQELNAVLQGDIIRIVSRSHMNGARRWHEAPIQESFSPSHFAFGIQRRQECMPRVFPRPIPLPLLQTAPAGYRAPVPAGQILPATSGA